MMGNPSDFDDAPPTDEFDPPLPMTLASRSYEQPTVVETPDRPRSITGVMVMPRPPIWAWVACGSMLLAGTVMLLLYNRAPLPTYVGGGPITVEQAGALAHRGPPGPVVEQLPIHIDLPLHFGFNDEAPRAEDAAALADAVTVLRAGCVRKTIVVTGHTCDVGDEETNLSVGLDRARRVGDLLIAAGIDATQLEYTSVGSAEPVASNESSHGRRANRRVTLSCK
jgi:outer membrane protein OmpA-like peptidoglycan-associated protein